MIHIDNYILGETAQEVKIDTIEDNRLAINALTQQAKRSLCIYTRDLDNRIFDTKEFEEAVSRLARNSRNSSIRILIQNSNYPVKNGHRLIELAYRLSSFIKFRKPAEEYNKYNETFLIADKTGIIHRRITDSYHGTLNFKAPMQAKELGSFFEDVWRHSEPDPKLKSLHI